MVSESIVMLVTTNLLYDNRVRREAETLAGAGYDVTVFSHIPQEAMSRLGWGESRTPRAVAVPRPGWTRAGGVFRALNHGIDLLRWGGSHSLYQAALGTPARFYHAHDLDALPSAAALARRHGARYIFDTHELFIDQLDLGSAAARVGWTSRAKQKIVQRNYARLERNLIRQASAVITVSDAVAGELVARYGIARPTSILNTPHYRDLSCGSSYLRQRLGLPDDRRLILYQGGVQPERGLLELTQSLALLPEDHVLIFLGFNLGSYQEPIRREIDHLNLQPRVHLLEALPREQLLDATASADVGIQLLAGLNLNHRLTLPNKLFEYMMAGLPFISTDWPEVGRVVRETGAGMAIAGITPEAIASAIRQVLASPATYTAMRQAGLAAARAEFNWEHQAAKLLKLYSDLV
jgi:glycosyltransferase involved in cell wall biosynthesis